MNVLDALLARMHRLSAWGIRGAGLLMLAAAVLVAVDVIVRKLFNRSLGGADELSGYAFAIACTWAFSYVLLNRGNVRVDALYNLLSPRLAALLDIIALAAMAWLVWVFTRYGFEVVAASWRLEARSNSALKVPLWIPQLLWWLGYLMLAISVVLLMLRSVGAALTGDLATVRALLSARTIQEDAADEGAYAKSLDAKS